MISMFTATPTWFSICQLLPIQNMNSRYWFSYMPCNVSYEKSVVHQDRSPCSKRSWFPYYSVCFTKYWITRENYLMIVTNSWDNKIILEWSFWKIEIENEHFTLANILFMFNNFIQRNLRNPFVWTLDLRVATLEMNKKMKKAICLWLFTTVKQKIYF